MSATGQFLSATNGHNQRPPTGSSRCPLTDFRRLHRSGLIACVYRAAEWRHKKIELAAFDLLQYLDQKIGLYEQTGG